MVDIVIFVGTESGNAAMVADTLRDELGDNGHAIDVIEDFEADPPALEADKVVLLCTATHGLGELPDNIMPLHDRLTQDRPDLTGIRYGVIALGDQTYSDTFCNAGRQMDTLFAELGGARVGERLEIDACTQPLPDEEAIDWAKEWVAML